MPGADRPRCGDVGTPEQRGSDAVEARTWRPQAAPNPTVRVPGVGVTADQAVQTVDRAGAVLTSEKVTAISGAWAQTPATEIGSATSRALRWLWYPGPSESCMSR